MNTLQVQTSEPLNSIAEEALLLKVPISWLYSQTRRRGKDTIPHVRVGKYIRFYHSHVLAWLKHRSEVEA